MMILFVTLFVLIGTAASREPDIDINRIRLLPLEAHQYYQLNSHGRRSVPDASQSRTNDYDDHSSWHLGLREPLHFHAPSTDKQSTRAPINVYQPRQDPRYFYQSDAYLIRSNGHNVNHEVSFIYPGRETIRANEEGRLKNRKHNFINDADSKSCVRCPHDRTVIARPGSDKVLLQTPRILSCSGLRSPSNYHFVQMYGPKFGSLIGHGSHMIIGRIVYKNKSIHLCNMQVHVVVQGCPTPKYLVSHCDDTNKTCNFTCRNPRLEIHGQLTQSCGNDMKWVGELPVCRGRTWCMSPPLPDHGSISCKGTTAGVRYSLVEGSKCRVRCALGWRGYPRAITVCRRGTWTNSLTCQRSNKYRNT